MHNHSFLLRKKENLFDQQATITPEGCVASPWSVFERISGLYIYKERSPAQVMLVNIRSPDVIIILYPQKPTYPEHNP